MITHFGVGSAQVPEETPAQAGVLQTAAGLARSEGKEHPGKLMDRQMGGHSSPQGHQGTGAGGRAGGCSGQHLSQGRGQQGARICGMAPVLHPSEAKPPEMSLLQAPGHLGDTCCPSAGTGHHPTRGFSSCWLQGGTREGPAVPAVGNAQGAAALD